MKTWNWDAQKKRMSASEWIGRSALNPLFTTSHINQLSCKHWSHVVTGRASATQNVVPHVRTSGWYISRESDILSSSTFQDAHSDRWLHATAKEPAQSQTYSML